MIGTSKYGLPAEVIYCKLCVESNQRMMGSVQHADSKETRKDTILFDAEGICSGCRYHQEKRQTKWEERERELKAVLDRFRRKDGYYDVLVPGSGGKDSRFAAHVLKHKYAMNPL